MVRRLRTYLLAGLLVVLPVIVSVYILFFMFSVLDSWLSEIVHLFFPGTGWVFPGLGVLVSILTIILFGWLTTNMLGRRFIALGDKMFSEVPIIRSIYKTIKQIVDAFWQQGNAAFKQVVMIEYPRRDCWVLAFVTGPARGELESVVDEEMVNLFVPTTPNPTSGYLVIVPKSDCIYLKMTVEEGLKLIVSGGVFSPPYGERE